MKAGCDIHRPCACQVRNWVAWFAGGCWAPDEVESDDDDCDLQIYWDEPGEWS